MTKIVFIRHGEPDYTHVYARKFIGHGLDLGPLTPNGVEQARSAATDHRLSGAQLIVSSPYTRAMETAAIISRIVNLDIKVEVDLHEWLPDLTFRDSTEKESHRAHIQLRSSRGICPPDFTPPFEDLETIFNRVKNCLVKYLRYEKIIVVCHAKVMRQFAEDPVIPYCGIREVEFHRDFLWPGFRDF